PAGFVGNVNVIDDGTANAAPHVAAASGRRRDPVNTRETMRTSYSGIPFRPKLVEMMRRYLATLAESEGPSLINCMAGKDRTGFAVAMLHHAVGVHPDDVMADYLLTNTAGNPEERIAAGLRATSSILGDIDEATLRVIMGVEAEYLETAYAAIGDRHGS